MDEMKAAMLIDKGVLTSRMTSRNARVGSCRKCHRPVVSGLDARVAARDVDVDVAVLSRDGELWCVFAGREVFALIGGRLEDRTAKAVLYRACSSAVHARHRCGEPVPARWLA